MSFILVCSGIASWSAQIITIDALGAMRISMPGDIHYQLGASVSGIGDFNGDGYQDAAIGAPLFEPADIGNEYDTGAVFILSGIQLVQDRGEINLSDNSFQGVSILGRFETQIGQSIDGAGDVNGDSYMDVAIGSASRKAGYLIFGNPNPPPLISLNDLQHYGVEIAQTGYSVAGAGDYNGDGYADVVFGNPEAEKKSVEQENQEKEYDACRLTVVFGSQDLDASMDSRILGKQLLSLRGVLGMRLGEYVCGNIDVNADGYTEIIAVAPKGGKDLSGRAYLFYGPSTVNEADYKFAIDHANSFVRRAGDVNGDGFPELLVGCGNQSTFILWGGDHLQGTLDLHKINSEWGVLLTGAPSTFDVGDVNGDGFADVAVGLPFDSVRDNPHSGRVVILFGTEQWPENIDVSRLCSGALSALDYLVIEGTQPFGAFGSSISALRDIQNDGWDDIIVGAPFQMLPGDIGPESPGAAYVIQGKRIFQSLQTRRSIFLSSEEKKNADSLK
ncbi:MAG: FG-GAP repeat protein [Candidatus Omnitrophica bacterium]|nr:FG-GAP repeat protein [Candidatus Omnitrophota bacterium]